MRRASISQALSRLTGFPYSRIRSDSANSFWNSSAVSGPMRDWGGSMRVAMTGVGHTLGIEDR
jgi:hypothetical protein